MAFYFALPEQELQQLVGLSMCEKVLLSPLCHTLRQGVYLQQKPLKQQQSLTRQLADFLCFSKYVGTALKLDGAHFNTDEFFPPRLTGSSIKEFVRIMPLGNKSISAIDVFQLSIWRTFAFGDKNHIKALMLAESASPDLDFISVTINRFNAWGGPKNIAIPVHGTFQFIREKAPQILSFLWEFPETLSNDYADRNTAPTFAKVYQSLADKNIPSIPTSGIIIWQDLAEHIMPTAKGRHGTPAGPTAALKHAAALAKEKMPKDATALTAAFRKVFEILNNPTEEMPTIQKFVWECEQIQGRKLDVVDFEHALCKIARQLTVARRVETEKQKA